ncbi:hypothetical protein [Streptomyces sp. NPDC001537]
MTQNLPRRPSTAPGATPRARHPHGAHHETVLGSPPPEPVTLREEGAV